MPAAFECQAFQAPRTNTKEQETYHSDRTEALDRLVWYPKSFSLLVCMSSVRFSQIGLHMLHAGVLLPNLNQIAPHNSISLLFSSLPQTDHCHSRIQTLLEAKYASPPTSRKMGWIYEIPRLYCTLACTPTHLLIHQDELSSVAHCMSSPMPWEHRLQECSTAQGHHLIRKILTGGKHYFKKESFC